MDEYEAFVCLEVLKRKDKKGQRILKIGEKSGPSVEADDAALDPVM